MHGGPGSARRRRHRRGRPARTARHHRVERATIVTAQELGRDEAADLARCSARWHYQRNGLNTVLWADPWALVDDKAGNQSRDWAIPEGLWPGATVLACRLVNGDTKQYVWAASTHLCSTGSGTLPQTEAARRRQVQATELARIFKSYRQIVMGADLNSPESDAVPTAPRPILRAAGWKTDTDQVVIAGALADRRRGIDSVLTKSRVTLTGVTVVPTGTASDHEGRLAEFTVTDPRDQR